MLVKITTYNNTVYKFASKTTDTTDGIYLGRLRDDLSLTSIASASGTVPASQNLTIYNADNYIPKSENFWGASLLLTQENGLTWLGKVTFFNFDSDGNLYLTASEKGAPELELQLPDEVRQVYTIDNNFHQSSTTMTIPLAIGGSTANPLLLPTILIDKTEGVYLICVGEIRSVLKVYNGTEELPSSAYQAYKGTASQALHPGFAYVKINEDYRTNADGSYAEINVELVGLKLGTHTEAECRNGARFLLWFLKTASSGINGWGCGIPESEIDVASFNSAISLVDLMGLKLDGIMWLRQSAQNWIDQICQAIHGSYSIGSNGKRKLTIDYAGAASKKTFNASKIILNKYGKDSYVSTVYNKGILSYGYNPITGLFMQSAQFENADSIAQIGEQKFVGESYLIQDASTALAILEYNCKKSLSSAEAIDFTTDDLTTDLFAGDIITLDRSDIEITGEFQITSISTSDTKSEITAVRFDRSVFTVTGSHSNVNWGNEKQIIPAIIPANPTNLVLSSGTLINEDGTANVYIDGTFDIPEGGWLFASVQVGETVAPTSWSDSTIINGNSFRINFIKPNTVYSVRIRLVTSTGHSDYITATIRTLGDLVAPPVPLLVASTYLKTIKITASITNPPYDLAGFEIWRSNIEGEHGQQIGYVAATNGSGTFVDIDAANYLTNFYYSAKAIDKWGNKSDYSSQSVANCSRIEVHDVVADWVMANTFETALNVGPSQDGVKFNAEGIEGWYDNKQILDLNTDSPSRIGGWTIGENRLSGGNIYINSDGSIRTADYVSGLNGWSVSGYGNADFNDVSIRGTLKSVNFEKDTVSTVGGQLMVNASAELQTFERTTLDSQILQGEDWLELLTEDNQNLFLEQSGQTVYYTITVDDASAINVKDILRIRNADTVADLWLVVQSKNDNTLVCSMLYGSAMDLQSGMTVVNYGKAGTGGILLDGNAPKMDMFTHNGTPWQSIDNHLRIGNLNGFLDYTANQYGIAIGNSNAYLKYDPVNSLRIKGNIESTYLTANAENVILGTSANPWMLINSAGATFSGNIKITDNNIQGRNFIEAHGEYANSATDYVTSDFKVSRGSITLDQRHYTNSSKTSLTTVNSVAMSPTGISAITQQNGKTLTFSAGSGTIGGVDTAGTYIVRSDLIQMTRDAGGGNTISYDNGFSQSKDNNNYSNINHTGVSFHNSNGSAYISHEGLQLVKGTKTLFQYSSSGAILIANTANNNTVSIGNGGIGATVDGVYRFKTWAQILG